jgi:hypothetical protein
MSKYKEAPKQLIDGWMVRTTINTRTGEIAWTSAIKPVSREIQAMMPDTSNRHTDTPLSRIIAFVKENILYEMPKDIG